MSTGRLLKWYTPVWRLTLPAIFPGKSSDIVVSHSKSLADVTLSTGNLQALARHGYKIRRIGRIVFLLTKSYERGSTRYSETSLHILGWHIRMLSQGASLKSRLGYFCQKVLYQLECICQARFGRGYTIGGFVAQLRHRKNIVSWLRKPDPWF
jgi:hypothetical protein